jgi:hypothetical protein
MQITIDRGYELTIDINEDVFALLARSHSSPCTYLGIGLPGPRSECLIFGPNHILRVLAESSARHIVLVTTLLPSIQSTTKK